MPAPAPPNLNGLPTITKTDLENNDPARLNRALYILAQQLQKTPAGPAATPALTTADLPDLLTGVSDFAGLPEVPVKGQRGFIDNAASTTFAAAAAGGGTNAVPVYYDGTVWRIG